MMIFRIGLFGIIARTVFMIYDRKTLKSNDHGLWLFNDDMSRELSSPSPVLGDAADQVEQQLRRQRRGAA